MQSYPIEVFDNNIQKLLDLKFSLICHGNLPFTNLSIVMKNKALKEKQESTVKIKFIFCAHITVSKCHHMCSL